MFDKMKYINDLEDDLLKNQNNDYNEMLSSIIRVVKNKNNLSRDDLICRLVDLKRHSRGDYFNAVEKALDLI